jgi:PAS domain S-box-containing protein
MSEWLKAQMDFIYIGYGLAFFFLAIAAWSLDRQRAGRLAWGWLMVFGIIHGANLWLEGLMFGWHWVPGETLRLLLRLVSLLCLLEFGRASLPETVRRYCGPWLPLPLLAVSAVFAGSGLMTLQAVVRYAVGFPAGLLATAVLLRYAAQCAGPDRWQLRLAAFLMGCYALLIGLIPSAAPWPPASFLNEVELRQLTYFPAQIWRGLVIFGIALLLWWHYRRSQERSTGQHGTLAWWHYLRWGLPFVILLLAAGWVITEQMGRWEQQELRSGILWRIRMVAAALDSGHVAGLRGTRADVNNPHYQVLKSQLISMCRVDPQARFYYLNGLNHRGEVFYFADSEPSTSKAVSLPGNFNRDASPAFRAVFRTGQAITEGPLADQWGTWVSALAPVRNAQGQVLAVVGLDVEATDWAALIASRRMWPILAVMLLLVLLIGAFIVVQRLQLLTDWLTDSEVKHRSLFENSGVAMALLDAETLRVVDANPAAAVFYGYPREKLIGMLATQFSQRSLEELRAVIQTSAKAPVRMRGPHRLADGAIRTVEVCVSPMLVRNRRMVFIIVTDVTDQVRAERTLQENETRLRKIYDSTTEWMLLGELVRDAAGAVVNYCFVDCNASFLRIFGLERRDVIGRLATQVFGALPPFLGPCAEVVASGQARQFESFYPPLARYFEVSLFTPEPQRFALFASDITARKYDEQQVHLQGAALAAAANGMIIMDREGKVIWTNPAFTVITGYELREVQGKRLNVLRSGKHSPEFYAELEEAFRLGRVWSGEVINKRKDGRLYTDAMTVTPVRNSEGEVTHFVEIKQDVTEQRTLQEQYLQAQKMESIGRVSAGIAHDFNNQLQGILGFSDLLRRALPEGDQKRADVEEIRKAAHAAADLTRQLMAFGRRQALAMQVVDINKLVGDNRKMYQRLLGEDMGFELKLAPDLERIKADPGQLDQVLMNLLVNARDAMPNGGRVTISTYNVTLDARDVSQWKDVRPGRFIVLSVSDTGVGIPPENLTRIFEPFFTTKEKHRGTGLGLATVYGIAGQHEGWVHVYSQVGEGTTFKVYLPVLASTDNLAVAFRPAAVEPEQKGNGQRILLVEDEDGVRSLAVRVLTESNYHVTAAATVGEARKLYAEATQPFELVLSDVVLPDGNGLDLVEELLAKQPGLRVLMASGYTDERSRWPAIQKRGLRFVPKPYPVGVLLRTLHEVITEPAQPPPAAG